MTGRLTRSRDRMIAGVCAGIAEHFGWTVGGTRIAYLLLSVISAGFPGTLVYIILWALIPVAPEGRGSDLSA